MIKKLLTRIRSWGKPPPNQYTFPASNSHRTGRRSGRTTKLLKALPDGGVYICPSGLMIQYIRPYVEQQGRKTPIHIVSAGDLLQLEQFLRGRKIKFAAIDNAFFDSESFKHNHVREIYLILNQMRVENILVNDAEGDVIITSKL
jgi:hypothetical protein